MSYWFTVYTLAGVNVILAYSVYASYMTGQVSIGQAAFFGIGAYVAGMLTVLAGFDLFSAVVIGGLVAAAASLIVGVPTLRLKGYHFTIATVAFAEAVRVVLHNLRYGRAKTDSAAGDQWLGPDGAVGFRHISYLNDHNVGAGEYALMVWTVALACVGVFWLLERSRVGLVMRTIEEDEVVAKAIGIHVPTVKVSAFAFGGFLAGVAGGLYAHLLTFVSGNDFIIHLSIFALAYVVIGGAQTRWGPLLGATIFTILPETLRIFQEFRVEMFGLLILLVMLFKPAGLVSQAWVRSLARRLKRTQSPAAASRSALR